MTNHNSYTARLESEEELLHLLYAEIWAVLQNSLTLMDSSVCYAKGNAADEFYYTFSKAHKLSSQPTDALQD